MRVLAVLLLFTLPASAQTVISGDTIKLNGTVFTLWGIYAPEIDGTCRNGWPAGRVSADYLAGLIQGRALVCSPIGKDVADPRPAMCTVDSQDVAAAMVSAGMAWARLSDGQKYVVEESQAMSYFLGVHGHQCTKARNLAK